MSPTSPSCTTPRSPGMELKADLRGALERGELHVAYQPIVDIDSGAISGSEALMRWDHPSARRRPADRVHPAGRGERADPRPRPLDPRDGLPPDAGVAATRRAVRAAVSVNLSGRQIADREPRRRRRRASWPPPASTRACLTLEITESVLVHDVEATIAAFRGAQGARHPPRDRRLRDGLLVAQLPAAVPDRHPQDRPLVRRQPRWQRRLERPRPLDHQPELDAAARHRRRGHRDGGAATRSCAASGRNVARATCSRGPMGPARMPRHSMTRQPTTR